MKKVKRSRILTDRPLQVKFIAILNLICCISFLFTVLIFRFYIRDLALVNPELTQLLSESMWLAVLFGFVLIIAFTTTVGLFFSNRITGPIFRVNHALAKLAKGEAVEVIHVRKKDYMRELTENLNQVIQLLDRLKYKKEQGRSDKS